MKTFMLRAIIIFTVLLISCQKEDNIHSDNLSHEDHILQIKNQINYNEFKNKLIQHNKIDEFENNFNDITKDGDENYIVYINTDEIITFTKDSLTTYTLSVVTNDQDHLSFTNVVYIEKNDKMYHKFLKYHPTENWVSSLLLGNKLPFEGLVNLIDSDGSVLASVDINEEYIPKSAAKECTISATPIWQNCYGIFCPCPDGSGYLLGWDFFISCSSWGGGGSGGSGNPGGGEGPGGGGGTPGGGSGGQGDLPTDPLEWALFMQLHDLLGQGNFYLNPDLDPNNSLQFDTFEDFEDFINADPDFNSYVDNEQDGTHTTVSEVDYSPVSTLRFFTNQTLKTPSQNYILHSITHSYTGFTVGTNWQLVSTNVSVNNDIATIHIYGELIIGAQIDGIGVYATVFNHYRIQINILTGEQLSILRME